MKRLAICICMLMYFSAAHADYAKRNSLTLGFMPYLASQQLLKKYQPLADYLSRELGISVELVVAKDYGTHLRNTGENRLDISFLGGSPYIVVTDEYGPKPLLVRYEFNKLPAFRAVVFTYNDSDISCLEDLKGKEVVFGSRKSTLSAQVPYYMLMEAGLGAADFTSEFLNNHENVIYSVAMGEFDAGAAAEDIYMENIDKGIRALAFSPYLSTHVFVASSKLDPKLQKKIKESLISLSGKPEGRKVLESISPTLTGFVEVKDSDYDLLRGILSRVLPTLEN